MAQARDRGVGAWQPLDGTRPSDPIRRQLVRGLWSDFLTWIVALFAQAALDSSASLRTPAVDLERGLLRSGRRTVRFEQIDRARIGTLEQLDDEYGMRLFCGRIDVFVPVRWGSSPTLHPKTRELLLAMLPATSIQMPVDRYDPTGKFARYNFPGYLTRDEAIAFVTDPPVAQDTTFWG